ncbi:hypothetical protein [Comamonas sp. NoAH]|uniref:hypothetical protein n=1 Tax=Comamonas halotolerans TaxID=3041496 RepID=UPI0024E146D1|nr:hypothetical protein [Comamonas sp. NoAH]
MPSHQQPQACHMRWISLSLSFLTLPLMFLILPALVFSPAALVTGIIAWQRARQSASAQWNIWLAALNAIPIVLALLVGGLAWWILSTQYRA